MKKQKRILVIVSLMAMVSITIINIIGIRYIELCPAVADEGAYHEQSYSAVASASLVGSEWENEYVTETSYLKNLSLETAAEKHSFSQLQSMFQSGRYWNGGNANSTTSRPCNHGDGSNLSFCNNFGGWAYQCIGYAMHLSSLYTGQNPLSYKIYSGGGAVDHIKPGSVVRFNINSFFDHAILITGIDNDGNYWFTDANYDNRCGIRWNACYSRGQLQALLNRRLIQYWSYGMQESDVGFVLTVSDTGGKLISDCDVTVKGPELIKNESKPSVVVKYKGKTLTPSDYGYSDSNDGDTGTVLIYGRGDFVGERSVDYSIIYGDIGECIASYTKEVEYEPYGVLPQVQLTNKYGDKVSSWDYDVEGDGSDEPGEHTMTVSASSVSRKYKGSLTLKYNIGRIDIAGEYVGILVDSKAQLTDGSAIPNVHIYNRFTCEDLIENVDYEIKYTNNTKRGDKGIVTITGIGKYSGTFTDTFEVVVENDLKIH